MNKEEISSAATFSMIVASVIEAKLKFDSLSPTDLFSRTGISQPTWSRMRKGHSKLDLENLYEIENEFGYHVDEIMRLAKSVEAQAKAANIKVIPPVPTNRGRLTLKDGMVIVAIAVLCFMAIQTISKKQ